MAGEAEALNMRLVAHDTLAGFGGIGEGMSMQLVGGRRILWLAHESAPKNFTGVDVTDPKNPKVIVQTDLPHRNVRSNSLEVSGDIMAVAYQTNQHGLQPAGFELFDVSKPEAPKSISFFDCSGPKSRGVHQLWFVDGKTVHFSGGGAPGFDPRDLLDDQCYRAVDVSNPSKPQPLGHWWYPGTSSKDVSPPPTRTKINAGFRAHNTNVYPERPNMAYVGYIDGGSWVLDISDIAYPKPVIHWNPHPPFPGFTHTVMPLFDRDLLIVSDECVKDGGADWPKMTWIVDVREPTNPVSIATLPLPPLEEHAHRGGRYGSHNMHENRPGEASFKSSNLVFATYFNGGVRVHDITDPFQPREIAYYVPEAPAGSKVPSIQINDIFVDENRMIYAVDRWAGGLYVLEMTV